MVDSSINELINESINIGDMKQMAQVVCKKCKFNLVFMNIVKYADVFAYDGNGFILNGFTYELRVFYENEITVHYVHDGVSLFM